MCLNINQNYHKKYEPLVAHRPLLVYKRLYAQAELGKTVSVFSPYQSMKYEFGKLYEAEMTHRHSPYDVHEGLHTYTKSRMIAAISAAPENNLFYFPAVIPKGAKLFVGKNSDIVSNQLIVYESLFSVMQAFNSTYLGAGVTMYNEPSARFKLYTGQ